MASIEDFSNRINRNRLIGLGDPIVPIPSRVTRIGNRDPATGLWEVLHPNGSVTLNGIKMFNVAVPYGTVVSGIPRGDGFIALNYRNQRIIEPIVSGGLVPVIILAQIDYGYVTTSSFWDGGNSSDSVRSRLWALFPTGNPVLIADFPSSEFMGLRSGTVLSSNLAFFEIQIRSIIEAFGGSFGGSTTSVLQNVQQIFSLQSGLITGQRIFEPESFRKNVSETFGGDLYPNWDLELPYTGVFSSWFPYGARTYDLFDLWGEFTLRGGSTQSGPYRGVLAMPYPAYNNVFGQYDYSPSNIYFDNGYIFELQYGGAIPFDQNQGSISLGGRFISTDSISIEDLIYGNTFKTFEYRGELGYLSFPLEYLDGKLVPIMSDLGIEEAPQLTLEKLIFMGFSPTDNVYSIAEDIGLGRPISQMFEPELTFRPTLRITSATGKDADRDRENPLSVISIAGSYMVET